MHRVSLDLKQRFMHQGRVAHAEAEAAFVKSHPIYARTKAIDTLRSAEYGRLDNQGHTYLDHTGGSVYAQSQVQAHSDLLAHCITGNPHSGNLASLLAQERG